MRTVLVAALNVALSAAAAAQPSTVIVVRHAEKAATPGNDPALSDAGIQRAKDLADALAGARVTTVIATQFQRTQLTAKAISDALGKPQIIIPAASPIRAHVEAVASAVRARPVGDVVLVVGHSNTVAAIVAALGGPELPDLCDPQYSLLFVLEFQATGAPRLIKSNYGAADPKDAAACSVPK